MLGQLPHTAVRLAVGFGVDTAGVPNHEIFTLWRAYLSGPPDCARPQRAVVSRGATAVAYWGSLVSVRLPGFYELHPRSSCSCDGAGEHVSDPHAGRHRLRFFSRREATGLLPRVCDASRRTRGPCQCSPPSHARVEPRDDRAHHVRVSPESGIFTVPG